MLDQDVHKREFVFLGLLYENPHLLDKVRNILRGIDNQPTADVFVEEDAQAFYSNICEEYFYEGFNGVRRLSEAEVESLQKEVLRCMKDIVTVYDDIAILRYAHVLEVWYLGRFSEKNVQK
jgi:hypothetical protein